MVSIISIDNIFTSEPSLLWSNSFLNGPHWCCHPQHPRRKCAVVEVHRHTQVLWALICYTYENRNRRKQPFIK